MCLETVRTWWTGAPGRCPLGIYTSNGYRLQTPTAHRRHGGSIVGISDKLKQAASSAAYAVGYGVGKASKAIQDAA